MEMEGGASTTRESGFDAEMLKAGEEVPVLRVIVSVEAIIPAIGFNQISPKCKKTEGRHSSPVVRCALAAPIPEWE